MIHVHVDVDDLWVYAAEYGTGGSEVTDSVYREALPRFLDLFAEAGVKATFFVVGRDLRSGEAQAFCRDAVARGHELANHTFTHPIALHRANRAEKEREIVAAGAAIADASGVAPVGFRAPGYYLDSDIVDALIRNGYLYDSSILPSYVQPLMGLYIRATAGRSIDKRFGTRYSALASQGLRRIAAPGEAGHFLYELPVSVLPLLRLPIHSTFSFQLPDRVRRLVNATYRRRGHAVVLFHAIDAVGDVTNETLRSRVLPLRLSADRRVALIREALAAVGGRAPQTTRDRVCELEPATVRRSRVLRFVPTA